MKSLNITLLALILLSCTEEESKIADVKDLRENWVDIQSASDTLSFATFFDDKEVVFLRRAEMYRSGPYEYQLLPNNKISIHWTLASTMKFDEYHFEVIGDQLKIGNFYDSSSGSILTFQKIN